MKTFNDLIKEQRTETTVKNKIIYKIFEAIQKQDLDFTDQYIVTIESDKYSNVMSIGLEDLWSHSKYKIEVSKED